MPKGNHKPTKKAALVVLSDKANWNRPVPISKLQQVAIQQIQHVRLLERESALRAVLCGFALHHIKAKLKHGEFMPWIKKQFKGAGHRQANNYMRLAAVAVERAKVTRNQLQALPSDDVSLDVSDAQARRLMANLTKFVGDKSLNELLREHGIKDSEKPKASATDASSSKAGDKVDPDVAAQTWREGMSEWLESGHHQLIKELPTVKLNPAQIRNIESGLSKLLTDFRKTHRALLKS